MQKKIKKKKCDKKCCVEKEFLKITYSNTNLIAKSPYV